MAVSSADFYAYSRATGALVPEDPEERMRMAPEVLAFRRNQLRAPETARQEEQNPLMTGVGIGLALAGAGAAAFGARRLMRGPKQAANAGIKQADLTELAAKSSAVQQVAEQYQPAPSQTAPQGGGMFQRLVEKYPETQEEFRAYRPDPKEMIPASVAEARRRAATEDLLATVRATKEPYQPELPGVNATLMALRSPVVEETVGVVEPVPLSRPLEIAPQQQSLFNPRAYLEQKGSLAPIEDLTSIQQQNLPQVIDQKINAVESGEDQITGRVRQQLQRNEDLDVSAVDALEDQTNNINVAASQTVDGLPVDQAEGTERLTAQEMVDIAKQDMIQRRQALEEAGYRPGTTRFEKALAAGWSSKAGTVPGSRQFAETISLPKPIRAAVELVEPSEPLIERTVLNIGPQAVVTQTAAGTAIRGATPSLTEALPKQELRQYYGTPDVLVRGAPDELTQDIPGSQRVRGIQPALEESEIPSKQEIVYSSLNRPVSPAEFVEGGSAGIGVYGIEPGYVPGAMSKATGEYSLAATRRPTYVSPALEKKQNPMKTGFEKLSTPAIESMIPSLSRGQAAVAQDIVSQRQRTQESLTASEVLRRARIEGRDPQQFLRRQLGGNI